MPGSLQRSWGGWRFLMGEVPLYVFTAEARPLHQPSTQQGYLAHKQTPAPRGPPWEPRHGPTAGSYGVAVS